MYRESYKLHRYFVQGSSRSKDLPVLCVAAKLDRQACTVEGSLKRDFGGIEIEGIADGERYIMLELDHQIGAVTKRRSQGLEQGVTLH